MKTLSLALGILLLPLTVTASEFDGTERAENAPAGLVVRVNLDTQKMTHFQAKNLNIGNLNDPESLKKEIESITEDSGNVIDETAVIGVDSESEFDENSSRPAWYYRYIGPYYRYSWWYGYYNMPRYYYWGRYRYHMGYRYHWHRWRYHFYW